MKLGVLYSGGKDSNLALILAKKYGHKISCLISIASKNKDSYMFHTPEITKTKIQANQMNIPIIIVKTKGERESELKDLEKGISEAIKKYKIEGLVTGAVESVYQSTRIQKIANKLNLDMMNPLWQKNQIELLQDLQKEKIEAIIVSVAASPLDKKFLGRTLDNKMIKELKILQKKYHINPAGEGGEYESLVLNSKLFKKRLRIKIKRDSGKDYAWRRELVLQGEKK